MAKKTDPTLAAWKKAFSCVIHPYLPQIGTLMEMEDHFAAASGYLQTLDAGDPKQAALGVAIGKLAVEYAEKLFDHFGLWDGGAVPMPVNLAQARLMVDNLLAEVRDRIRESRLAMLPAEEEQPQADEDDLDEQLERLGEQAPDNKKPIIHHGTFEVEWKGKKCRLGNSLAFKLFEFLSRRSGYYYSHKALQDGVWGDDRRVEKNTIQKTVGHLKKLLAEAGLTIEIDGKEREHYAMLLR